MDTTIRRTCSRANSSNSPLNHLHHLFNVRAMLPKSILIDRLTPSAAAAASGQGEQFCAKFMYILMTKMKSNLLVNMFEKEI